MIKERLDLRKPRKTRWQIYLREAEKSVSGALIREFQPSAAEQKAALRSAFSAAVGFVLCQGDFLRKQVVPQLSAAQLEVFLQLEKAWDQQSSDTPPLRFAAEWFFRTFSPGTKKGQELTSSILVWLGLATRHIHHAVRGEPEPEAIDWGRRESAFREKFESLASGGGYRVDLEKATFELYLGEQLKGRAELEVLGVYSPDERLYEAGWAAPGLPDRARPHPVMSCASRLFRANPTDAQAQAQRCAWLSGAEYIVEHRVSEQLLYLGLGRLKATVVAEEFSLDDVRGEVLAKFRALEKSLSQREAERAKDAFLSASRELGRRASLFNPDGESYRAVRSVADALDELGQKITTQSLFGAARDRVKGSEQESLTLALQALRESWQD